MLYELIGSMIAFYVCYAIVKFFIGYKKSLVSISILGVIAGISEIVANKYVIILIASMFSTIIIFCLEGWKISKEAEKQNITEKETKPIEVLDEKQIIEIKTEHEDEPKIEVVNRDEEKNNKSLHKGITDTSTLKKLAILIFKDKGYSINYNNCTFASSNSYSRLYWANPNKVKLEKDWYLVLNNEYQRKFYLFKVPKNADLKCHLKSRSFDLFDIQIYYNDPTFTDSRSLDEFIEYKVDESDY